MASSGNIAARLRSCAERWPDKRALIFPLPGRKGYGCKTFRELEEESNSYARGFLRVGIGRGTKTIMMVKPGPELFSILFALFKVGAVPVVVDPGMGVERMMHCYRAVGADAFIGIPVAQVVRVLFRGSFASIRTVVTVGHRPGWGGHMLADLADPGDEGPLQPVSADDLLMINFTTGATGPAKGVEYTHGIADGMVERIISHFDHGPDDIALAPLPLFAVFHLLIGATAILPPMDPTKPARVDGAKMIEAIASFGVTHMFASPAFLHRVGQYAATRALSLPSLEHVIAGGAPVSEGIARTFVAAMSEGAQLHITYGATEALPIASITAAERAGETRQQRSGRGTCVGRPLEGIEVRAIAVFDDPIERWSEELALPAGEVGEIVIAGPTVSRRYHGPGRFNALMKIGDGDRVWHRTGDLGWLDGHGRIWFCGRKSQRLKSRAGPHDTVQWEEIFNAHADVYRTALVGVGEPDDQTPVVCVELRRSMTRPQRERVARELREIAEAHPLTRSVGTFLFHDSFPVDIRHNAKIDREALGAWAARRLGRGQVLGRKAWLRLVPIAGWLFILFGIVHPFSSFALWAIWSLDLFLSVAVHGAQLVAALPLGRGAGYSRTAIVLYTLLFGATWWKLLPAHERAPAGTRSSSS